MKHNTMTSMFWLAVLGSLLLRGTFVDAAMLTFTIAYSDVESFPNALGTGTDMPDPPGICVEIIRQAAAELNLDVEFVRLPNKRVLNELRLGKIDAAFLYSFKEDRLTAGQYPMQDGTLDTARRIATQGYYIYKQQDAPLDWDGRQFTNQRKPIGANSGYSIVEDLRKKGIPVDEVKTTEQNLQKLQVGRIDGFATEDTLVVDYYVATKKYGALVKLPTPLVTKDYFVLFSHQFMTSHADVAEQFWSKIGEIRDALTQDRLPNYLEKVKPALE